MARMIAHGQSRSVSGVFLSVSRVIGSVAQEGATLHGQGQEFKTGPA